MRIVVPSETAAGETRVALVPRSITQLASGKVAVAVQAGAGAAAGITDQAFIESGAEVVAERAALLASGDITVVVRRPEAADIRSLREGSVLVGVLEPSGDPATLRALLERNITSFRLEAMPRISRAQDMDVLSSMATLAGYHASVMAAFRLPRLFPLLMTAAGTLTPARVLVLGAGVAGLQAIATCRRLGAVVEAFDVRPAVKEQVESLGARFVEVGIESSEQQDAGGYAKELSQDAVQREHQVLAEHVRESDVVITTAMVPNRRAPTLVTKDMVDAMRPGSVIVDLAAASGGNCEYTEPDKEVRIKGVLILGPTNVPAAVPGQASQLYSHNVTRFLAQILKDGELRLDFDDEVVAQTCMTSEGKPRGEQIEALLQGSAA
ncbi:MAG: Re/Si-specific NAD(P)(+) transhydrogenase subunit alpha [Candidatus Dormibacteraeota bacterium]|nr:Re/Si-specific NAD(P)(+) transhydrogenase subunit alpha [Candidatus Dormibacteraeota bacterium]